MPNTKVIGRMDDEPINERAQCEVVSSVSIPFEGAAIGVIHAVRFASDVMTQHFLHRSGR